MTQLREHFLVCHPTIKDVVVEMRSRGVGGFQVTPARRCVVVGWVYFELSPPAAAFSERESSVHTLTFLQRLTPSHEDRRFLLMRGNTGPFRGEANPLSALSSGAEVP